MGNSKIVAQLYTVRKYCGSEADIARSMEKLRKSDTGLFGLGLADIPARRMREIMDSNGLNNRYA